MQSVAILHESTAAGAITLTSVYKSQASSDYVIYLQILGALNAVAKMATCIQTLRFTITELEYCATVYQYL